MKTNVYIISLLIGLIELCISFPIHGQTPDLLFAVVNEDLEGVRTALQEGADPSARMRELIYDLNYYTTSDSVPLSLRESANRNETALHYAIKYFSPYFDTEFNSIAIIEALINAQADVNASNLDGDTPLDSLLARKKTTLNPRPPIDILWVIDNSSSSMMERQQPSRSNENEVDTENNRPFRFFERDNSRPAVPSIIDPPEIDSIETDPPETNSIEMDVLEQLYPQNDILSFIEDIEKILLAAGAKTQFDIEHSEWLHH